MIQIIHGELWSENFAELDQLIKDFQSCVRFSYNRFSKDNLEFNDIRRIAKVKYPTLNSRQVADAVLQGRTSQNVLLAQQEALAEKKIQIETKLKKKISSKKKTKLEEILERINCRLKYPKLIFGGRKAWEELKAGKITKEQWTKKRDGKIYSRGEKTHNGNLNIRIIGNTLRITVGIRKWVNYKLFIPEKFRQELNTLLANGQAYNIRLKRKDNNHFKVMIDYQINDSISIVGFTNGVIGIDTNPDRIALANVSSDGNLIESKTIVSQRLLYARANKRDHDVGCLVKDVINYAKEHNKGIVFENLKFEKDKSDGNKKCNRTRSNFVWKKFLMLLERKCIENGIQYKKVNPAYTSIIGKYKYRWMHKITIHESAAYVIGRRGLGYNEKLSFYKYDSKKVKELVLRTVDMRKYKNKKVYSWTLWKHLNDNLETVLTALPVRLTDLKELVGNNWCKSGNLLGEVFLKELAIGSNT